MTTPKPSTTSNIKPKIMFEVPEKQTAKSMTK